jgi:hypothetical protein
MTSVLVVGGSVFVEVMHSVSCSMDVVVVVVPGSDSICEGGRRSVVFQEHTRKVEQLSQDLSSV